MPATLLIISKGFCVLCAIIDNHQLRKTTFIKIKKNGFEICISMVILEKE